MLIIACPARSGLATPMSIMVGVGRGAQSGVLIKNAEALERMEKVDTLVIDKTGTLTEGKPSVVGDSNCGHGIDEAELLRLAASVERASEHPLAAAIVARAQGARTGACTGVENFDSPVGKGAIGTVEGKQHRDRQPADHGGQPGSTPSALETIADDMRQDGATAIFVAIDGAAGRRHRHCRSDQADDAGSDRGAHAKPASASSC